MLADSKHYKMPNGGTLKHFHIRVIALEVKMMDFRKNRLLSKMSYSVTIPMCICPQDSTMSF